MLKWLPFYYARELGRSIRGDRVQPSQIIFCVCDHFEPYWNGADAFTARQRLSRWLNDYPKIVDKYIDADGNKLGWSFFYPEEEYQFEDLNALAELCHAGYGDVEIHLHHDNDTSENLRQTLIDYKHRLHESHGLLHLDPKTNEIIYAFIHGNWALCNCRKDGRWCGVNDELNILQETGCYADFTLPSAPSDTQTRKINSLYYANDIPGEAKSHDWGLNAKVGEHRSGLLMVQGPLMLDWGRRKFYCFPRIENSALLGNFSPNKERLKLWIKSGISVDGAPDKVFIKLHTHGAQESIMKMLFDDGGLDRMLKDLTSCGIPVKFTTAKQMADEINSIVNINHQI